MSYAVISLDYGALAAGMLPTFKQHAVIDFDDDDAIVTKYLKWAAALVEAAIGQQVGAGAINWFPEPIGDEMANAYPFPVTPVDASTMKVEDTATSTDITANFEVRQTSLVMPIYLATIDGSAFPASALVTYTAGFASGDDMPPNLESAIYRVAAQLYENRESITSINVETMPLWLNDLLVGLWVPRA